MRSFTQFVAAAVVAVAAVSAVVAKAEAQAPAPLQFFVAPGQVGSGEAADAKVAGMYRYFLPNGWMVGGPPGTHVWNLDGNNVYGYTPAGAEWGLKGFNLGTAQPFDLTTTEGFWFNGATVPVRTFKGPTSSWWAYSTSKEGLSTLKAPKLTAEAKAELAKLKRDQKDLAKQVDELEKQLEEKKDDANKPKSEAPKSDAPKQN